MMTNNRLKNKIGVTERGDAAIDLSWVEKLDDVAGAIVITKALYKPFVKQLIDHQDKLMLHLTCTGYGATVLEPNVHDLKTTLVNLGDIIRNGFPVDRIVVRVDPIIPTDKGIAIAKNVIENIYQLGVKRIRVSVLDMYRHVQERFRTAGLPLPYGNNFQASVEQFSSIDKMLLDVLREHNDLSIESCSEPMLKVPKKIGCISDAECSLFNVTKTENEYRQRNACLCCGEKVELLSNKHRCPHGCLYCYWKD